ncbi:hypothetical protein QKU48_gp1225 [Fadolivirus algeromassiliense]|jgi:hypothetical protein|uniref:Uncharacterized protein n=1 Tax=Fadolivirus FV1/VV64 TaxID=3070911 RepID=A0A7D3QV88_9VIRU|nr:hypothetical protein QKU48_gp1225 [Fadolivirus algeromassiliense]QKF94683.1 hypothetical protein Fadolivirus_1_1225 [Fadolivirus FV1/VV64]
MSSNKDKCSNPKPCGGKCYLTQKEHCEHRCDITAEKNLLNLTYLTEGSGISEPDVSATFEIVIFNRSNCKLSNLSICDSFMGLQPNTFGSTGDFGGEVRPYFTNVSVTCCSATIFPNNFDQIVAGGGELINKSISYVPANSLCSLIVRITGRGFRLPQLPDQNQQLPFGETPAITMCVQNTAIIRGNVTKKNDCGCVITVPIFPLYVKSGEKQAVNIKYNLTQLTQ